MCSKEISEIARLIEQADCLFVGAGAGMSVDSGLPVFQKGSENVKGALSVYYGSEDFQRVSTPRFFEENGVKADALWRSVFESCVRAEPHAGYNVLKRWFDEKSQPSFVYTSNFDGLFLKAGFDPQCVLEAHGSIHFCQCLYGCGYELHSMAEVYSSSSQFLCAHCGSRMRPNILLFSDRHWVRDRAVGQEANFTNWLSSSRALKVVTFEIGAGATVQAVRTISSLVGNWLVRINSRQTERLPNGIMIPMAAEEALCAIDSILNG